MSPRIRQWTDDPASADRQTLPPTPARLYSLGLRALARREQTSSQLRDRLVAAGGREHDVAEVLDRLRGEGALDDRRAARVYAQTAFRQRKRARGRIARELDQLGITADVVREVLDDVCGHDIEQRRLDLLVIHALRGTRRDHRGEGVRRLLASLVRQGYDIDAVRAALSKAGVDDDALDE